MEVVIFIGLQGAGKSTFYRSRFAATHCHISKDNFLNVKRRNERQRRLVDETLAQRHSAVIDNTNLSIADRAPLIAQAKAVKARVVGYYFASQLQACLSRNGQREGRARVPDVALYVAAARLQKPSYREGFDALFYVCIGDEGAFIVEKWQEENG